MKTAKEILNHYYSFVDDLDEIEYNDLLSAISFAQDDAYNKALEDAAENADFEIDGQEHIERVWIDKGSILKLKK